MKKVLLYSGGMDSMCAAWMGAGGYDALLRVPSGAGYDVPEAAACAALAKLSERWAPVVTVERMFDFSSIERPGDRIVPNRNAHLVLAASLHGEHIEMAAVKGDRSCDKDEQFCAHMTALLDHMWQKQHWTPARQFHIELPYKHLHKAALLRAALALGMPHTALYLSYSCYTGNAQHCGLCKPCVRKYVAMTVCGVHAPRFVFAEAPHKAAWLPEALTACKREQGWRCKEEDKDFLEVFG